MVDPKLFNNPVRPGSNFRTRRFRIRILYSVRKIFGGERETNLVKALLEAIKVTNLLKPRVLDFGTGSSLVISKLYELGTVGGYCGVDIYSIEEDVNKARDKNRQYFRLETLEDLLHLKGFEIAMASDALHHLAWEEIPTVLDYLSRSAKYVIIKDCFEYSFITRQLLRLSDWFGNSAYGVNTPKKYLSISHWELLLKSLELVEVRRFSGVKIHQGLFGIILPARCHFVSILSKPKFSNE